MSKKVILEVRNLTKQFGRKIVLDDISFQVYKGEIFGIIGMSGSGKTTLLNSMIGFLDPDDGKVLYGSARSLTENLKVVHKNKREVERRFGFAAQDPSFYLKLSIAENLRHFGGLYGFGKATLSDNMNKLLKITGLKKDMGTLAGNLSGGMQKRLDIACSMIHNPPILLLDEPTADLDPILRKQMWDLIRQINDDGTTIILSSHFLNEMEHLCSRIGIIHNGKMLEAGTPNQLKLLYSKNEEISLETAPGRYKKMIEALRKEKDLRIEKIVDKGHKIVIYTPQSEKVLHHVVHIMEKMNEKILDVSVNKPTLNEIFQSLIDNDNLRLEKERKEAARSNLSEIKKIKEVKS